METIKPVVTAFLLIFMASGCLVSEDPFCQQCDIVVNDRLVGTCQAENDRTSWRVEKSIDHDDRYFGTLFSDTKPYFMRFGGVVFRAGTNQFLDLLPMVEAPDHVAGGPPSPIAILQAITLQPLHMVVKVDASTNGVKCAFMDQEALLAAARKFPEYFQMKSNHFPRILPGIKRQREFLVRFGGDTNVFKVSEIKRQPEPPK